uniref:Tick transposon n=1 Tax=Anisakis simplex TaxID=6269 RepID=A0A0M3J424_ANISI
LAVHLLQCQPSHYVQSKDAPKGLFSDEKGTEQNSDTVHVSSSMMTFPPMPVYVEEAEQDSETQPEDPTPLTAADSSISGRSETVRETLTALKTSASFTSEFVHKIDADEDYSCVELRRCKNCDEIVTAMSRSTQTATPQPPRPKMVDDFPRIHFSLDERIGEQIV